MDKKPLQVGTMTTVCTFLWGDWPEGGWYLQRLFQSIIDNSTEKPRLVAFVDQRNWKHAQLVRHKLGCELKLIETHLRRNLNKMYVFDPVNEFSGQVITIDLDVLIVGNMDKLLSWRGRFATCRGALDRKKIGGSITSFNADDNEFCEFMWKNFDDPLLLWRTENITSGFERKYFSLKLTNGKFRPLFWDDMMPGVILSYKRDIMGKKVEPDPEVTSIVRFHGNPRPHLCPDRWVKQLFYGGAYAN